MAIGEEMDKKERIKELMREAEELEERIALLQKEREKIDEEMEQLINEVEEEEWKLICYNKEVTMKKLILSALMVVMLATPCMAELEPYREAIRTRHTKAR